MEKALRPAAKRGQLEALRPATRAGIFVLRTLCQFAADNGPGVSPKMGQVFSAKGGHRFSPKLVHGAGLMP